MIVDGVKVVRPRADEHWLSLEPRGGARNGLRMGFIRCSQTCLRFSVVDSVRKKHEQKTTKHFDCPSAVVVYIKEKIEALPEQYHDDGE